MTNDLLSHLELYGLLGITLVAGYFLFRIALKNRAIGLALLAALFICFIYNVYNNNRIVVKQEIIYINNLPAEFEDFKILQISDLHGKVFGQSQSNLIAQVNEVEYDMIAFTGDMETTSFNFDAFTSLLAGISKKDSLFYVNGNDDLAYKFLTGVKTDTGLDLEKHGCILLTEPYPIERNGKVLWLVNDITRATGNTDLYQVIPDLSYKSETERQTTVDYIAKFQATLTRITNNGDTTVALTHRPLTPYDMQNPATYANAYGYDLILAGHYHGGQFRIPGYGAFFIPIDYSVNDKWLFPEQQYVSGLVKYNGPQQFVSRGLGASRLPFRLFNTPEINLITLKSSK